MNFSGGFKLGIVLAAATALAGCTSSGGGGNGGGGGGGGSTVGLAEYQGEFDRVTMQAPTSDMPTRLQANFVGAMQADVQDNTGANRGSIIADLDLDIDWTDGQTTDPFSGGAKNFRGTTDGGTTVESIAGELTVDPSLPNVVRSQVNTINLPPAAGGGTQTLATGAYTVNLTGDLTLQGETVEGFVQLGGNFFGPGAQAAAGPAVGGFRSNSIQSGSIFDGTLGGTHYLERR